MDIVAKNLLDENFSSFTSLIDSVEFSCKDWSDPEKIGISSYVLYSKDLVTDVRKINVIREADKQRQTFLWKASLSQSKFIYLL